MASQYFDAQPRSPSARERSAVALPDLVVRRADRSRGVQPRLARHRHPAAAARGAAAGGRPARSSTSAAATGAIALALARRAPAATVWAVDVNERARALCRGERGTQRRSTTSGRSRPTRSRRTCASTTIWSNPPIRIGKAALHELLRRWLGRLSPTGPPCSSSRSTSAPTRSPRWLSAKAGTSTGSLPRRLPPPRRPAAAPALRTDARRWPGRCAGHGPSRAPASAGAAQRAAGLRRGAGRPRCGARVPRCVRPRPVRRRVRRASAARTR